ncbi:MAG: NADH-quinone oxidoreductase subunit C, partial [Rhodobacteraceae bacterium]|nr:NADH-quinone oxidoreductase subunit C [Paracoccaceae bacterium]
MTDVHTEAKTEALAELEAHLAHHKGDALRDHAIAHGELTVSVGLGDLVGFVRFLQIDENCRFSTLVDITAVDYPERRDRFEVVYHFLSMYRNQRIRVKVPVTEEAMVPSITDLHPSANWFEREVFDMFGIL